ncbi:hypothetical protein PpBr36_09069 [Pyricularia pennisetigena]|uniref:hypothetical protein n=1 Tax=Pyricularia pennisetigena TaxID=1578925 RepID=UPI00114DB816|nr:hypothetical protein PpBr36_09069 [Pyricularia pennisetigena]TLS24323.1 hypothetical protein PpBr36_09069 [Pyricularia pennisetigena]
MDKKEDMTIHDDMGEKPEVVGKTKEMNTTSAALAAAIAAEPPQLMSSGMLKLYAIMSVGYLVSTMNGFDGSLMGAINDMKTYQETFGLSSAGSSAGIVFIVYNLGQIAAFPFCPLLADGYGRRWCIFIGCVIVLVGTAIQGAANTQSMFIGGRFVLGLGASIASAAAPAYTVELAHPAYRGFMAGMYNNFWWIGNILAGWTTYGTNLNFNNAWAWRVPTILQCALPSIVMVMILFFPESPRWLIAQDRTEEALAIFAKYHGDGNPDSAIVQLQYREIVEEREAMRDDNPWWDFRELVNTRSARYRLSMVVMMAFFGQWSGNNVVSYFMPAMVKEAGINDGNTRLLLNAINPLFGLIASVFGAYMLDRVGRRFMMLAGLTGALFFYVLLTAFTAEVKNNPNLSYGVIVSIYLFGIFFAAGFTPLQTLYSMECLTNRTRAKGSGINFLFLNIAMIVNTYGIAVGMEAIQWKLYLVYIAWISIEIAIIYFFAVETAGKTLEELGSIFEAPNPRKASTQKTRIEVDEAGNILSMSSGDGRVRDSERAI